jgi:hypothetical protein
MNGAETFKAGASNGKSCVYDRIHMDENVWSAARLQENS